VNRYRQEVLQQQMSIADVTVGRIVVELARVAFSDPGKMFDDYGHMLPISEMDEDTRRAISGFDVEKRTERHGDDTETYYVLKPRLWNKNAALDTLAKLHYTEAGELRMPTNGGTLAPQQPVVHVHFVAPPQQLENGSSGTTS
jgi:phage terminase small subunit